MNKNKMLLIVNPLMAMSLILQAVSGNIMNELFHTVHKINGPVLSLLAIAHIALNWSWIKAQFSVKKAK